MHQAGWSDVWHMTLGIVGRQPPFLQIAIVTGVAFVLVMVLEGVRSSLVAIRAAHRAAPPLAPPPAEVVERAAPSLAPSSSRSFSAPRVIQAARRPKPLTVRARKFRDTRPTIRRHPVLDLPLASETALYAAEPEGI
jgi:hypothetical protein